MDGSITAEKEVLFGFFLINAQAIGLVKGVLGRFVNCNLDSVKTIYS